MGEAGTARPDGGVEVHRLGPFELSVATSFGPRIVGFRRPPGGSLFARLGPDVAIEHPSAGPYRFRGGHRLWAAPEEPSVTYQPDERPCEVAVSGDRLTVMGVADAAGLAKAITAEAGGTGVQVGHTLTNAGSEPVAVAPWALTQFRLGGAAILPFGAPAGESPRADRSLVLWPYTDLSDRRLSWRRGAVVVTAAEGPPLKMGAGPDPARLGYLLEGVLFIKEIPPADSSEHVDRGAVGQVYLDRHFCELESLGGMRVLQPGEAVSHSEHWRLESCEDVATAVHRVVVGR